MAKPVKIAITERFAHEARIQLESEFEVLSLDESSQDVEGIIIRSRTRIDKDFFVRHPQLKVIVTATSGFDHIDLNLCEARKIQVMHCPQAHVTSTAELALLLTLASLRKLPRLTAAVRAGEAATTDHLFGHELSGKTVGIIGLGRIGKRFREFLRAFDCTVLGYDPYLDEAVFQEHGVRRVSLEEIVKESDIVSLHVPKTAETSPLMTASVFEYCSSQLIIINCARGSVLQEGDLVRALIEKKIAAVGLDVFEKEPLPRDSRLLKLPNVVFTPHMGAKTEEALLRASLEAARKLKNFFATGRTEDALPPVASWYLRSPERPFSV